MARRLSVNVIEECYGIDSLNLPGGRKLIANEIDEFIHRKCSRGNKTRLDFRSKCLSQEMGRPLARKDHQGRRIVMALSFKVGKDLIDQALAGWKNVTLISS